VALMGTMRTNSHCSKVPSTAVSVKKNTRIISNGIMLIMLIEHNIINRYTSFLNILWPLTICFDPDALEIDAIMLDQCDSRRLRGKNIGPLHVIQGN